MGIEAYVAWNSVQIIYAQLNNFNLAQVIIRASLDIV